MVSTKIPLEHACKNYGDRPGCLKTPDPAYTMQFNLGEEPILWCSFCGPKEHQYLRSLEEALRNDPDLITELEKAVAEAETTSHQRN